MHSCGAQFVDEKAASLCVCGLVTVSGCVGTESESSDFLGDRKSPCCVDPPSPAVGELGCTVEVSVKVGSVQISPTLVLRSRTSERGHGGP